MSNFKENKLLKSLLFWVILAIIAGIGLGYVMPVGFISIFVTFSEVFSSFLGFAVPLIILGLITPAIAGLGKTAGKWVLITVGIAYASTLVAGFGTFAVGQALLPTLLANEAIQSLVEPQNTVPSLLGGALSIPAPFGVITALVMSFVLGIGMAFLKTPVLNDAFLEFKKVIMLLIRRVIVPLLPVHILSIFMNMTKSGEIAVVIAAMAKVVILSIILTIVMILLQYLIAAIITQKNPFVALKNMLPAYFTALGTASSAATIPVTLACTEKNGVSQEVAGFAVPLCATIHLAGSTTKIVAFAMSVMFMSGISIDFVTFAGFICMLGVTMIAAPGVPGGAITAAQGVLEGMLGFTNPMYGLMVALYVAIDSFGTACNVTGDGAIALVVNKLAKGQIGERLHQPDESEFEIA